MALLQELDTGTPIRTGQPSITLTIDGREVSVPPGTSVMAAARGMLGHGGVVVFDDTVDMAAQARFAMKFCAVESCGKCTPCRIGSTRGIEVIDRIVARQDPIKNLALIEDLCETMRHGSLCALGGLIPDPVRSAMKYFPEDFAPRSAA